MTAQRSTTGRLDRRPPLRPGHFATLTLGLAGLLVPAASGTSWAQAREPLISDYRFVSEFGHGIGLWTNPATLGLQTQTSLFGQLTMDRVSSDDWKAGQFLVGFQAGLFGVGYRHDEFSPPGVVGQGDAYTLGFGIGTELAGFGVTRTWRTVGATEGSWELGWGYNMRDQLSLGLVWRDIGSPEVRDTTRDERILGAFTVRPGGGRLALSAQVDLVRRGADFRRFRGGVGYDLLDILDALALVGWDGDGDFEGFFLGLRVGLGHAAAEGVAGLGSDADARTATASFIFVERTLDTDQPVGLPSR